MPALSYVLPTPTSIIACSYFTRIRRRSRSGSSSCRFSSLKAPQHFVRTSVIFCSSCQCVMLLSQKLRTIFLFKQDRNSIRRLAPARLPKSSLLQQFCQPQIPFEVSTFFIVLFQQILLVKIHSVWCSFKMYKRLCLLLEQ